MRSVRNAFTLLESLIVLSIACLILLVATFGINHYHQGQVVERAFWTTFQNQWNAAERFATTNVSEVSLLFDAQAVHFIYYHNDKRNTDLKYPAGLQLVTSWERVLIKKDGYVYPQTLSWYSTNYQQRIKQTFQLGWGIYRVKYE